MDNKVKYHQVRSWTKTRKTRLVWLCFMVFNAAFNNILVISWQSFLFVEETGEPGENHQPVANQW